MAGGVQTWVQEGRSVHLAQAESSQAQLVSVASRNMLTVLQWRSVLSVSADPRIKAILTLQILVRALSIRLGHQDGTRYPEGLRGDLGDAKAYSVVW